MPETIKSIQDKLLICSRKMPALEEFVTWKGSEFNSQKEAVIKWYENIIQQSEVKDSFCYLDLTFEVPDKGAITITFTSSDSGDGYKELLKEYIQQKHTIYLHPEFCKGYLADNAVSPDDQNFLIFKLEQIAENTPRDHPHRQIQFSNIPLQYLYDEWSDEQNRLFHDSNITEHVNEWINIHRTKRNSIKSLQGKQVAWILVIPVGILDNKDEFKLIGGLYLGLDDGCNENSILSFVRSVLLPLITNYQRYETRRAYKNAIKSAKAAIIARNMSHNLGSHVLYYLRQYLSGDITQFNEILENIVIHESESGKFRILYKNEKEDGRYQLTEFIDKQFEVPFLRGLGSFLTYLQERQDFIASVATDSIPSYTTVNFKNFVIDNLLKDKKAIRHGNESRKEKNILLDFIAKSENTIVEITFNGHPLDHNKPLSKEDHGNDLYSYMVDLPGGVLGRQAIYSILENIIRNAAKHGFNSDSKYKKLEIDISIGPSVDEDYFVIKITDNLPVKPSVVGQLYDYLKEDLIDKSHKLIDDHKGLKEILISALWLCGANVADITNNEREKYIQVKESDDGHLQYLFYLYRAKSLLVICDEEQERSKLRDCACIGYATYDQNREKCKRYNLVVDCTTGFKLEKDKDGFRRYVKAADRRPGVPDVKLYHEYFKSFLSNSFGTDVLNNTTFLISIDTKKVTNSHALADIQDSDLKKMFKSEDGLIDFSSEIQTDNKESKKKIAFRRHFHDMPNEFFNSKFARAFDINNNDVETLRKIKEAKRRYASLETITGNNSSFSMIANAPIDDNWVLRQLEAGYAKVLIIDERLFDTFSVIPQDGEVSRDFDDAARNKGNSKPDYTKALLMSLKNVDIANFTETTLMNSWGRDIGSYDPNSHSFVFTADTPYQYISVHQGVLDKLFNLYGKGSEEKKDEYFRSVLKNLKGNAQIKCLIHTGRGKPNYIKGRMAYRSLSDLDDALKEPKIYLLDYFNCASYEE